MGRFTLRHLLALLITADAANSMIITSVLAGRKKYKTISFDYLLPPLAFVQPNMFQLSYRGHKTIRPPNFKLDVNMPIRLPISIEQDYGTSAEHSDYSDEERRPAGSGFTADIKAEKYLDIGDNYARYNQWNPHRFGYERPHKNSIHGHRGPHTEKKRFRNPHHPYTGKAQVSSWIDSGHFVHANRHPVNTGHHPNLFRIPHEKHQLIDEAFEDQVDGMYSDHMIPETIRHNRQVDAYHPDMEPIRRASSFRLGYQGKPPHQNYMTALESQPDSVPLPIAESMPDLSKYYTSMTFTNGLKDHYPGFHVPRSQQRSRFDFVGKIKDRFLAYKALLPEIHF